jgi:hypothetical protein
VRVSTVAPTDITAFSSSACPLATAAGSDGIGIAGFGRYFSGAAANALWHASEPNR